MSSQVESIVKNQIVPWVLKTKNNDLYWDGETVWLSLKNKSARATGELASTLRRMAANGRFGDFNDVSINPGSYKKLRKILKENQHGR